MEPERDEKAELLRDIKERLEHTNNLLLHLPGELEKRIRAIMPTGLGLFGGRKHG